MIHSRPPRLVCWFQGCVHAACLALLAGFAYQATGVGTPSTHLYSFQEFYTDAQYGPDFGYYSTGRILHDLSLHNGSGDNSSQNNESEVVAVDHLATSFNSYTTWPMSLSPHFGAMLADRLYGMWCSIGKPQPYFLFEFGGGTGVLARDILRRIKTAYPDFFNAVGAYILGERSDALRVTQQRTAHEFVTSDPPKLRIVPADARSAAEDVRRHVSATGVQHEIVGTVLSNELLDEMDPVKLRLYWPQGLPPTFEDIIAQRCDIFRENFLVHRIDHAALVALLRSRTSQPFKEITDESELSPSNTSAGRHTAHTHESANYDALLKDLQWEHSTMPCEILLSGSILADGAHVQMEVDNTTSSMHLLKIATSLIAGQLTDTEAAECYPLAVCCLPLLLAAVQLATSAASNLNGGVPAGDPSLVEAYRRELVRTRGTVFLSKQRYRFLRRLAGYGTDDESSLLFHTSQERIHTDDLYLRLSAARCEEIQGWVRRHSRSLAVGAYLEDAIVTGRKGKKDPDPNVLHLKLIMRPGEAGYVKQVGSIVDRGFMLTIDYGADFDALLWLTLMRPNFEGIHIMDARAQYAVECTQISYLQCPGLQDMTTSVDFTEVAEAGEEFGWEVRAYGPMFLLESAFDPFSPNPLIHLLERVGGIRTVGVKAWYNKPEFEPWASFKVMVQEKVSRTLDDKALHKPWSLAGASWPLVHSSFFQPSMECWQTDASKPPFPAFLATFVAGMAATERATPARGLEDEDSFVQEVVDAVKVAGAPPQGSYDWRTLLFRAWSDPEYVDKHHVAQQHTYADMHLTMILVDYWRYVFLALEPERPAVRLAAACGQSPARWPPRSWRLEVGEALGMLEGLAEARRLRFLYTSETYERIIHDLTERYHLFGGINASDPFRSRHARERSTTSKPPHVCLAISIMKAHCEDLRRKAE